MNSEFRQFVKDVRIKVPLTYNKLLKQAQNLIDEDVDATLTKIELSGSYSPKSKKQPTENSDIDLLVTYKGTAEPEQLVKALAGKLYGEFGFYDVQATKEHMINEKSLPHQFIQEVFQEDGEGGGAPAASVSANPANLSTGGGSTLSKQAPEHMRLGVVTPFGNIPSKKKKAKKKGWPYN